MTNQWTFRRWWPFLATGAVIILLQVFVTPHPDWRGRADIVAHALILLCMSVFCKCRSGL